MNLDHVEGWTGSLQQLAEAIGRMRYDKLSELIDLLAADLERQAMLNREDNRQRLASVLMQTSVALIRSATAMQAAWEIDGRTLTHDGG